MRRLILLSVTALALCTFSSHAALSQAQAPHAVVVALVAFGPPGNTDYQLDNATSDFSKRLTAKASMPRQPNRWIPWTLPVRRRICASSITRRPFLPER